MTFIFFILSIQFSAAIRKCTARLCGQVILPRRPADWPTAQHSERGHSALRTLVSCISRVRPLPLRPRLFLPNFLSLFEKCIVPSALLSAAANAPLCLEVGGMEGGGLKGGSKESTHARGKEPTRAGS